MSPPQKNFDNITCTRKGQYWNLIKEELRRQQQQQQQQQTSQARQTSKTDFWHSFGNMDSTQSLLGFLSAKIEPIIVKHKNRGVLSIHLPATDLVTTGKQKQSIHKLQPS